MGQKQKMQNKSGKYKTKAENTRTKTENTKTKAEKVQNKSGTMSKQKRKMVCCKKQTFNVKLAQKRKYQNKSGKRKTKAEIPKQSGKYQKQKRNMSKTKAEQCSNKSWKLENFMKTRLLTPSQTVYGFCNNNNQQQLTRNTKQ